MKTCIIGKMGVGKTHIAWCMRDCAVPLSTEVVEAGIFGKGQFDALSQRKDFPDDLIVVAYPEQEPILPVDFFDRIIRVEIS